MLFGSDFDLLAFTITSLNCKKRYLYLNLITCLDKCFSQSFLDQPFYGGLADTRQDDLPNYSKPTVIKQQSCATPLMTRRKETMVEPGIPLIDHLTSRYRQPCFLHTCQFRIIDLILYG